MMNILLITNRTDITTDFVVKNLHQRQIEFYRFNTDEIGHGVELSFDFNSNSFQIIDNIKKKIIDLLQIKSVYYRRPELVIDKGTMSNGEFNFVRSELFFALEGLFRILSKAFWVNRVWAIRNAENKIYQLLLARDIGFQFPNSIVTNVPEKAQNFYIDNNSSCIIKPIKSGLVEGDDDQSVIFTSKVEVDQQNQKRVATCPVYLQQLIEKKGDIRITIVGESVFAALIHSQEVLDAQIDWRRSPMPLEYTEVQLPDEVIQKCLILTKLLDLNFAAIDFILDKSDNYIFLELNPNGQWAWIERQLNLNISNAIIDLMVKNQTN